MQCDILQSTASFQTKLVKIKISEEDNKKRIFRLIINFHKDSIAHHCVPKGFGGPYKNSLLPY